MAGAPGFTLTVDLTGLGKKLELLGQRVQTNLVRRALLAGAGVIRDEARRKAPVRTGALKKAIIAETDRKGSTRSKLVAQVKVAGKSYSIGKGGKARAVSAAAQKARGKRTTGGEMYPRAYAHLVEFGTKPHRLGKGSRLSKGNGTGRSHPGTKAQPFIRPAYDGKAQEAIRTIGTRLRVEIDQEIVKINPSGKSGRARR